jgi:two-component system, cell cycle response regulator DivK
MNVDMATQPPRASPLPERGRRGRVLVVDDDVDSRHIYAEYLRSAGWVVEDVADGEEALAVAATFGPHVIVMDIAMPAMDGLEATRRLKRDQRTREVPVVCVSAYTNRELEALRAGCAGFLAKPCAPGALQALIEQLVRPAGAGGADSGDSPAAAG